MPASPPSTAERAGSGFMLVPATATREWAYAMALARQGQSSTPRCEPTSEREIEWAADRIAEALAAVPTARNGSATDRGGEFDIATAIADLVDEAAYCFQGMSGDSFSPVAREAYWNAAAVLHRIAFKRPGVEALAKSCLATDPNTAEAAEDGSAKP